MAKQMNKSIISYICEENRSFYEKPFNDVDSLILSQLSYVQLKGLVGGVDDRLPMVDMHGLLKAEHFMEMFGHVLDGEKTKKMLFAMCASPRFRDIKLNYYEEIIDVDEEKQFSSVCFFLPTGEMYLAFRGTDMTIVGWKEDFNMTFMQEIPAQRDAIAQLERVAALTDSPIIVGGHSKGGNLAIYAGAKCDEGIRSRIRVIYSHDGPGFRKDVIAGGGFDKIADKVRKTLPEFGIVGMLLQHRDKYMVVSSDEKLLWQHDPFSWKIGDGDFIYKDTLSSNAVMLNESISQWLETLDDNAREKFVDTLYNVVVASGASRIDEFENLRFKSAMVIIDALKGIEPETRKFVFQIANQLAAISVKKFTGRKRTVKQLDEAKTPCTKDYCKDE